MEQINLGTVRTVGELRVLLANLPDDYRVVVQQELSDYGSPPELLLRQLAPGRRMDEVHLMHGGDVPVVLFTSD